MADDTEETLFDQGLYFRFANDESPNMTLQINSEDDPEAGLIMKTFDDGGMSENWHLYFESGRYFIRNYLHGKDWQLSLSETNTRFPLLRPRAKDLGQQWLIEEAGTSSKFKLVNELRGPDYVLSLSRDNDVPTMDRAGDSAWDITVNTGVDPVPDDMMDDVEVVSPTTTSTSSGTSTSSSASTPSPDSSNSDLSPGAIAGISIGAAAVVILAILAALIHRYLRRRQQTVHGPTYPHQNPNQNPYPAGPGTPLSPAEMCDSSKMWSPVEANSNTPEPQELPAQCPMVKGDQVSRT